MITVQLPYHLCTLAGISGEVGIELKGPATVGSVLDAIESRYPMLAGTIREHGTGKRRAYVRFFAAGKDLSHEGMDAQLPESVIQGTQRFIVLGAISGG